MLQSPRKYLLGRKLGEGANGQVFLATPRVQQPGEPSQFALKIIKQSKQIVNIEEQAILKSLRHPNVLHLYESYCEEGDTVLVLQYAENGDMTQFVRPGQTVSEEQLASWIAQIALGLDYLHTQANIIHRDIKLQNLLVMKNGLLKLADFGISRQLHPEEKFAKTTTGTPYNLAPEMVRNNKYDYKADIWGFGCLLSEICCARKPFSGGSLKQIIDRILEENSEKVPECYPEWIRTLIERMLQKEPAKRPDAKKILAMKEIQRAVARLKEQFPSEYKDVLGVEIPKTTKYLEREEQNFGIPIRIAESLKTAKRSERTRLDPMRATSRPRVDDRFYQRSLQFLVQQSQQRQA